MKLTKKIALTLALAALATTLAACNTTKGVGADIEKAGEGLKGSAERNGAD
jgi:predicted small secreted protein